MTLEYLLYYQSTHSVPWGQPLPAWMPRSAHLSHQGTSQFHPPSWLKDDLGQGQRALRTPVSSILFQATTPPSTKTSWSSKKAHRSISSVLSRTFSKSPVTHYAIKDKGCHPLRDLQQLKTPAQFLPQVSLHLCLEPALTFLLI